MSKKTSIGLDENVAGLLCYALGIVTGIVFYVVEKDNDFVRFHALQSIVVFGAITAIHWVIAPILFVIPFGMPIGGLLMMLSTVVGVVLWILLMVKAYQGERYKVPVAGDIAEKYL